MFLSLEGVPFVALIGDIKSSRSLMMRNEIQEQLSSILDEINIRYRKSIAAKFLITLGDEFQGLLFDGKNILKIIQDIRMKLYPVELRFGIGIGKISTRIDTEMALGADGPGYYHARNAIDILKDNEKRNKKVVADIRLEMEESNSSQVTLINTIFELEKSIEQTWTQRQREIIWDMMKNQDGQKDVAYRMGITQSSVQKNLAKGRYYVYANALKNVQSILGEIEKC